MKKTPFPGFGIPPGFGWGNKIDWHPFWPEDPDVPSGKPEDVPIE